MKTVTFTDPPNTGDDTPVLLYVLLTFFSGLTMAVILTDRRRDRKRQE